MMVEAETWKSGCWLPAILDEHRVMLIDYSGEGILLEHYRALPVDEQAVFLLEWQDERVAIICRVVHCEKVPVASDSDFFVFRSSALFIEHDAALSERIDWMVRTRKEISRALRIANAAGEPGDIAPLPLFRNGLVTVDPAARRRLRPGAAPDFVRLTLENGRWTSVWTTDSVQPADGFTVDAEEPPAQIRRLCEAYEETSDEGRNLIRAQARVAVEGSTNGRDRVH
ncbi:MAG TPA: hypothetical protein VM557_01360 [Thermoanaerobaculia bacterium]|nr:hypothetical protein [Thermoanaerobaculia bacterium]